MSSQAIESKKGIAVVGDVSYLDWGSLIAGSLIAIAMAFVLLAFGTSIGLSVATPWSAAGPSASTVGIGAAIWFALVLIWSVGSGAYLAGRLRPKAHDSVRTEVSFRDGTSGLVVWAMTIVASAILAGNLASAALTAAGAVTGTAATALSSVADRTLDLALRPADGQQPSVAQQAIPELSAPQRAELGRIVTSALARGELDLQDRGYIERLIAQKTGISPEQAKMRVTAAVDKAMTNAKLAADTARKAAASAGFWSAVMFLLSGLAAWWAGSLGGSHRDEKTL